MAEKKKNKLINAFDIAVIILIFLIAFAAYKLGFFGVSSGAPSDTIENVTYTLRLSPMQYGTENEIEIGDELFETTRKTSVGKVVGVTTEPTRVYAKDDKTGNYYRGQVENMVDAFVEIEAQCIVTDQSISAVDGQLIRCGETINVNGPGYFGFGIVVSVGRGQQ